MMKTIRIALVDDQELVRKGFKLIISSFDGMAVDFEAYSGLDLLEKLKARTAQQLPHIILLDLSMKEMDGVETAKRLTKIYPQIHVAILSMHYTPTLVNLMVSLNASAYFKKNTNPEELEKGLIKIAETGKYFTEEIYEMIRQNTISQIKNDPVSEYKEDILSDREKQVLLLICEEFETKEIAEKLSIGIRTIESHRRNLLAKTNSRNMAGLVIYAVTHGLFNPNNSSNLQNMV